MTPDEIWLRLMKVSNLYGDRMLEIAQRLCAAASVDREALHAVGMSAAQATSFFRLDGRELDETRRWLEHPEHHLLRADDPRFPFRLRAIADYPGALLVSETLARKGMTITSGLALGIDGVAHRGALSAEGKTIAVLGNGLGKVYPRRHASLAQQIIDNGGALVSEFPLITPPLPAHFPRRNRIISGLSLGVLVVEAALRSGSLVTVRCALEQGRDVFALPGPIGNPGSEGPHWLIKQGAVPVTSPEDIVEYWHNELTWLTDTSDSINNCADQSSVALPFPELLANVGDEVTPVDVVAERAGQSVPVTVAQLLELELAGWIAAVPGGYVRLRRASHVRRTHVFV